MARSGSINFNISADEIIKKALAKIGERDADVPLTNEEMSDGMISLNVLVKSWQNEGLHLWKRAEGVLFLDPGITTYLLGPNGAEATLEDDFVNTELTTAALATSTTLVVTSTTGMLDGDFIGIELDDSTRQWTSIVTVDSATGLTITDPLTGAAAIDNSIFTYTTIIERPLRIESARRTRLGDDTEVELDKWSRQEYTSQTNKVSRGTPTAFYYSPNLDNGEISIWQTAQSVQQVLKFTFQRNIEDFDVTANNPDFPIEWAKTLIWNLAADIGLEYEVSLQKMQMIEAKAAGYLEQSLGFDEEVTSLDVQPDFRGY
jgi:hypothetical protein